MIAAHDVGKAINPLSCEGQIEGGVVMSMGYALTEQYPIDENCRPTARFGTLGLFRAHQVPEIKAIVIDKPGLNVACGAIGIGEITSIPTAHQPAADRHALCTQITGRLHEMKVRKKFPSKVACVHCNGGCRANQSPEGYDLCLYGCTGCGACMEVCRFGAISLNSYGVAEVDESRCIGCGACYQACPQRVIHLRLEDNPIVVLCSNKDARCRDVCAVSCIGCGLCERTCPAGAIVVSENRAFIYADKCLSCGMCAMACPRNVIHDKRGLLTPRH